MIDQALSLLSDYGEAVNLVCCLIIFAGGLYVAINPGPRPHWLVTSLWYASASALFVASTLVVQFIYGEDFELAYDQLGVIGEFLFKIFVSIIAFGIFIEARILTHYDKTHKYSKDAESKYSKVIKKRFDRKD
jgi:hypothetical protein